MLHLQEEKMNRIIEIMGDEPVLEDNYPIYSSYWYLLDGEPKRSEIEGTVHDLKRQTNTKEIRRCAAVRRNLPLY